MLNWRIWTNVWIRVIPRAAPLPCLLHSAWCSESLPCNYHCITSDHLKGSVSLCKISGKRPQASLHPLGGWKPPWLWQKYWQAAPFASQHRFNVLFWFHQVVLWLSLSFFSPIHYRQLSSTVEFNWRKWLYVWSCQPKIGEQVSKQSAAKQRLQTFATLNQFHCWWSQAKLAAPRQLRENFVKIWQCPVAKTSALRFSRSQLLPFLLSSSQVQHLPPARSERIHEVSMRKGAVAKVNLSASGSCGRENFLVVIVTYCNSWITCLIIVIAWYHMVSSISWKLNICH